MNQEAFQVGNLIRDGMSALERGDRHTAQIKIRQAIKLDPQNEQAWLWAANISDTAAERIYCYEQVLKFDPYNKTAQQNLSILRASSNVTTENVSFSTTPETVNLQGYQAPASTTPAPSDKPIENPYNTTLLTNSSAAQTSNRETQFSNDPIAQTIVEKMNDRLTKEEIVRYVGEMYRLSWDEAQAKVQQVWNQHINVVEKQNNWFLILLGVGGIIFGIALISYAIFVGSQYMRTNVRFIGFGIVMLVSGALTLLASTAEMFKKNP